MRRREKEKNTPKGALCKYSNFFEERLLNCDALRAFLRPGFYNRCYLAIIFSLFQDLLLKKTIDNINNHQ